jgi:hypothetical protein
VVKLKRALSKHQVRGFVLGETKKGILNKKDARERDLKSGLLKLQLQYELLLLLLLLRLELGLCSGNADGYA